MVEHKWGEAQEAFTTVMFEDRYAPDDYTVTLALYSEPAFTTWAESLDENSDPFE